MAFKPWWEVARQDEAIDEKPGDVSDEVASAGCIQILRLHRMLTAVNGGGVEQFNLSFDGCSQRYTTLHVSLGTYILKLEYRL